jgi:processive 1,2-diacylglycerol beta-glucosyltransferase
MSAQKKVLILYARFGEGHYQAATALSQSLTRLGSCEARLVDLLAESHPVINEVSRFVYHKSYNILPQVYGWVYEATKGMKSNSLFSHVLHSFGAARLQKLIEKEKPDAVIHTFPILVLPSIAKRMSRKIPMFNVVTDFDLHMRWVHPGVDKYYVATDDLASELREHGIDPDRVSSTGIPLRSSFTPNRSGGSVARKFGLNPGQPVVLVMAGANGVLSGTRELCRKLTEQAGVQVAIVCGRNRTLEALLSKQLNRHKNVKVLGYVEQIDELMGLSDCIVTKPGGLTLSEAIAARLPIFLYRPVPGQERNNALYLENKGAALICKTPEELVSSISEVLENPARLGKMQQALASLHKAESSDRIALDILNQLHLKKENSAPLARG